MSFLGKTFLLKASQQLTVKIKSDEQALLLQQPTILCRPQPFGRVVYKKQKQTSRRWPKWCRIIASQMIVPLTQNLKILKGQLQSMIQSPKLHVFVPSILVPNYFITKCGILENNKK